MRHMRDVSNIRLASGAANGDPNLDHRVFADFKRSAGGVNAAGRAERTVEAERRALTPPSTA